METFGKRIRRLRKNLKLTQKQLAARMSISRVAISKWESGESENIKLDNLMSLCKILAISAEELITGKQSKEGDTGHIIQPGSDIKKGLMEHINALDDSKLTLAIVPIIHEVLDVPPHQIKVLQGTVHAVCQSHAEYHVNDTKSKVNGE